MQGKFFPEKVRKEEFERVVEISEQLGFSVGCLRGLYQNEMPITQENVNEFWLALVKAEADSQMLFAELKQGLSNAVSMLEERQ